MESPLQAGLLAAFGSLSRCITSRAGLFLTRCIYQLSEAETWLSSIHQDTGEGGSVLLRAWHLDHPRVLPISRAPERRFPRRQLHHWCRLSAVV